MFWKIAWAIFLFKKLRDRVDELDKWRKVSGKFRGDRNIVVFVEWRRRFRCRWGTCIGAVKLHELISCGLFASCCKC